MALLLDADFTLLFARLGGPSAADQAMIKNDLAVRAQRAVKAYVGFNIEQATYTEFYPVNDLRSSEAPLVRSQAYVSPLGMGVLETVGLSEMMLKQRPLRSIANVWENRNAWQTDSVNGDFSNQFLLAAGSDYTIDWDEPGLSMSALLTREGIWPDAKRTVKIVYTAGLTAGELLDDRWSAFKEAAMLTVQAKYIDLVSLRQSTPGSGIGPLNSERIGDWSGSWNTGAIDHLFGMKFELPPEAKAALREFASISKYFGR